MLVRSFEDLNEQARKRLQAIEDFSDIGSGLQIAMRDLDIRGAGDILGADQSGFISEIGFEMYQKILNEAILELHDTNPIELEMADNSALLLRDCLLETDVRAMLPTDYVSSVSERMSLYKELQNMKKEEEVEAFRKKLADMFGPVPEEAQELLRTIPLRRKGAEMHLEKISLKNNIKTSLLNITYTPPQNNHPVTKHSGFHPIPQGSSLAFRQRKVYICQWSYYVIRRPRKRNSPVAGILSRGCFEVYPVSSLPI